MATDPDSFGLLHGSIFPLKDSFPDEIVISSAYFLNKKIITEFNEESETFITKKRKLLDNTVEVGLLVDSESLLL